jgi:hypothetical protein
MHHHLVTALDDIAAHGTAHVAQPDKPNLHGASPRWPANVPKRRPTIAEGGTSGKLVGLAGQYFDRNQSPYATSLRQGYGRQEATAFADRKSASAG